MIGDKRLHKDAREQLAARVVARKAKKTLEKSLKNHREHFIERLAFYLSKINPRNRF